LDFSQLEQNICDVIKEEQIKLGYRREVVRLYYPLTSLNRFLHAGFGIGEMQEALAQFCGTVEAKLGKIEVSNEGERFCFCFPPEASEYIYENTPKSGFLYDFIGTVAKHGVTMEEVIALFHRYSDHVHVEQMTGEDFDYLVYFEDGQPDAFRYCLTQEGHHIIYHRFTVADYNDFY
jgi:sugar phosphate isomerase/epimerase